MPRKKVVSTEEPGQDITTEALGLPAGENPERADGPQAKPAETAGDETGAQESVRENPSTAGALPPGESYTVPPGEGETGGTEEASGALPEGGTVPAQTTGEQTHLETAAEHEGDDRTEELPDIPLPAAEAGGDIPAAETSPADGDLREAPAPVLPPKNDRQSFFDLDFNELDRDLTPEERQEWNSI